MASSSAGPSALAAAQGRANFVAMNMGVQLEDIRGAKRAPSVCFARRHPPVTGVASARLPSGILE